MMSYDDYQHNTFESSFSVCWIRRWWYGKETIVWYMV